MEGSPRLSFNKGGVIAKNSLINILGRGIPLIFAAVAIPFVIDGLGTARFGVLTIIWVVVGYFGIFDMGISRATKKFVADMQAEGSELITPFVLTSIGLLLILGLFGSLAIYLLTPLVVHKVLNIPAPLTTETRHAFYVLSLSIPFALGSVAARGALEARQQFWLVNAVKVPASIINFGAPLAVLPFTNRLPPIISILLAGRICTFLAYSYFSIAEDTAFSRNDFAVGKWIKKLLGYGSWVMISNMISPFMVYLDRFILGAILTMSAVAYYTTPYEVVTRLLIVSGGFMSVVFPAFSARALSHTQNLARLHRRAIRFLLLVMVPVILFIILAARPLLQVWLGAAFASKSTTVLQLLALGVLINSVSLVPYTALEAIGRPDITAKLHMAELPFYLAMVWYLIHVMGINGVALAWLIRIAVDGALLMYFSNYFINFMTINGYWVITAAVLIVVVLVIGGLISWQSREINILLLYAGAAAAAAFYGLWRFVLTPADHRQLHQLAGLLKSRIFQKRPLH